MNIHIGKAISKQLKEKGMGKSEFGRRINKAPSTVQDILARESIDTKLLMDISAVLECNFFALFSDSKQLGETPISKDKLTKIIAKNEELTNANILLSKSLKDKERIIKLLEKRQSKNK